MRRRCVFHQVTHVRCLMMCVADAFLSIRHLTIFDTLHRTASRPRNSTGIFLYVNAAFNRWHDRPTLLSRVRLTFVYFSPRLSAPLPRRYAFPIDSRRVTRSRIRVTFSDLRQIVEISLESHTVAVIDYRTSLFTCHVSSCIDARRNEFFLANLSLVPKTFLESVSGSFETIHEC